jgi:predicted aldo/keto reductase-like oxidoreductase
MSHLKIKIPSKNMRKNQQMQQLFFQFINYVWYLLDIFGIHCHLQGAFLVPSERC